MILGETLPKTAVLNEVVPVAVFSRGCWVSVCVLQPACQDCGADGSFATGASENDGCFVAVPAVSWQMRSNCGVQGGHQVG